MEDGCVLRSARWYKRSHVTTIEQTSLGLEPRNRLDDKQAGALDSLPLQRSMIAHRPIILLNR
jgi:hypothetical protein